MKTIYIKDLLRGSKPAGASVTLYGWISARRDQGNLVFLDVVDSTGTIQVVFRNNGGGNGLARDGTTVAVETTTSVADHVALAKEVALESAVTIQGTVMPGPRGFELHADSMEIVGRADAQFSPRLHSDIDVFDLNRADHLLSNRHLYIRNPKIAAILRYRHRLMGAVHAWFSEREFVDINAPILTAAPLYHDRSAISLEIDKEEIFLTQCVGFYLESAVHAFERVYNMGPSFRAEESRSKRHLMEYWHIKAELAWVNLDDLIGVVEDLIGYVTKFTLDECGDIAAILGHDLCVHGLASPFPRISYVEALERLRQMGKPMEFGKSLGSEEEETLSQQFVSPFWITGIPRTIEPFPYVIDKDDPRVTRTADLIATGGYGELLGVAEKIHTLPELDERMAEKGKTGDPRYDWVRQMREHGCVPHGGFGMGLERLIRWMLDIPHVRDTIPFPRIFRRRMIP